jgi:WD40 repeat protein
MDLEFSEDDSLLATCSGDQTGHVIDVQSQKSTWSLQGHMASVKRVQFQPGNTNILTTCARDGTVLIWDTRMNQGTRPAQIYQCSTTDETVGVNPKTKITDAYPAPKKEKAASKSAGDRNEYSVTTLAFVSPSRPYHFITASESCAVVKLWDVRSTHRYKRQTIPVACTEVPKSHEIHRSFGITSLAMSSDQSTFYTLCRDHTVYTYLTSHLLLGTNTDLTPNGYPFNPKKDIGSVSGKGPIYGFRHPALQLSTFYPRLSVRKATDKHPELIAVGSNNDCAVLLSTNPRYLNKFTSQLPPFPANTNSTTTATSRPRVTRIDSQSVSLSFIHRRTLDPKSSSIPIYYHGTPLIRGHRNEVTAVTWSSEGNLVTVSDDLTTRCWRENAENARSWRMGQEGEAERLDCGWADLGRLGRVFDEEE